MFRISDSVKGKLYEVKPRSVVYLFSGGKDSALALLLTRDLVRELCNEIKCKVYILYVLIPGNTHPLNSFASAYVMEWHRKHYNFEPLYKCVDYVFQEGVVKWGLQIGKGRWCFIIFKDRIFRETEKTLPKPQIHIDGMSPNDSKVRSEKIKSELEFIETTNNTRYYAWHPLYSVNLDDEEKLKLLKQYEEFRPIVELYEEFGDSLNCMLCPYKSVDKMLCHHSVEDLSSIYYFIREVVKNRKWSKKYSKLGHKGLEEFISYEG